MNTATQNLENDHDHILRLIDVMESMTKTDKPDPAHLEMALDLVRNFADAMHHAKEENFLFPKMVEKGFSFDQGPVAVMMKDHTEGRNYIKEAAENVVRYKEGDVNALLSVYEKMQAYIDLLRGHIMKENNILFRMADRVFSEKEQAGLLGIFTELEASNQKEEYLMKIEELAKIYLL